MKAKNQQPFTSEFDAKEKLIVYVYEYLVHSGAKQAADLFKDNIGYTKDIKINEGPGFLLDWWCVFWDLYCAAPERRHSQPESSGEARAFHDLNLRQSTPMSPSMAQTSPPQHLASQQPPPPQFMAGPRYGTPPRGPPPRMQGPPGHPPGHAPPGFMPSGSPRYGQQQHPNGPPPPPPHMNQVPMGFNPEQMSHSPGLNRMTPVGVPPPQQQQILGQQPHNVGPPQPNQMVGMQQVQQQQQQQQQQQMGGPPPQMQGPGGPQRNGSQVNGGPNGAWQQGNVNYNVNSPYNVGPGSNQPQQGGAGEPMMMNDGSMMDVKSSPGVVVNNGGGGEPSTPHSQDEYVMPVPFGQDTSDQCESAEILKLKQSMQEDTTKMFEKEQSEFSLGDYADNQNKWS